MRVVLLAGLFFAQAVCGNQAPTNQQADHQSRVAPPFSLKNLSGRTARLSDYKGKVVLINLWATWCAPCLTEMPALVKWQKEYGARGLQILGITYPDEPRVTVSRMARKLKLNYPVLFGTRAMIEAYEIGEVLPVTVVIGRDGTILDRILGILEPEEFSEKVAPLLRGADLER
ncbi:MAG: TlpA disulfide reductase family protein [Blastocatellia bacterium]